MFSVGASIAAGIIVLMGYHIQGAAAVWLIVSGMIDIGFALGKRS